MEAAAVAHCPNLNIIPLIVPGLPIIVFIDQDPNINNNTRKQKKKLYFLYLFLTKIPGKKSLLYTKSIIKPNQILKSLTVFLRRFSLSIATRNPTLKSIYFWAIKKYLPTIQFCYWRNNYVSLNLKPTKLNWRNSDSILTPDRAICIVLSLLPFSTCVHTETLYEYPNFFLLFKIFLF